MPYIEITPEEASKFLKNLEPDLAFILEDSGVSEMGRASLGRIVRTIPQFKNLADDRSSWRELMRAEFKLDETD